MTNIFEPNDPPPIPALETPPSRRQKGRPKKEKATAPKKTRKKRKARAVPTLGQALDDAPTSVMPTADLPATVTLALQMRYALAKLSPEEQQQVLTITKSMLG